MTAELRFAGATIVDGTGEPGYVGDVTVKDGRIEQISCDSGSHPSAVRTIDATGMVLSPGFIDMHAHSDLQLLANPAHLAKVSQGVTCEVLGQDGLSYAPVDDATLAGMRGQIAGWNDDPPGFDWDWRSVGEYLDRLDRGIAVNAVYLVPQGTVRQLVMGHDPRAATRAELNTMREMVAQGMTEGAAGLSAGLTYTPGMYATNDEIAELLVVTAALGGYFSPHHRSYGVGALEAYEEMIELARRTGCPLHLTHATLNFTINRGRAPELLDLLDRGLDDGLDITTDSYPYLPGATMLAAMLPSWASSGGPEATLDRLRSPSQRAAIRHEMEVLGSDGWHGVPAEWHTLQISAVAHDELRHVVGKTVEQIADDRGIPPADAYFDMLIEDELRTSILQFIGNEENVQAIMTHRTHCAGSDAILVGDRPHPRAWGTFPRFVGHYSRELGLLSLEECIHHMTGRPARRLKLADRGTIREGAIADLVLFDPETIDARSTFDQPATQAAGIQHVLVGGRPVIAEGRHTGDLPGTSLRRSPDGRRVG